MSPEACVKTINDDATVGLVHWAACRSTASQFTVPLLSSLGLINLH